MPKAIIGEPLGATTKDPRHDICPYRGLNPFREEDAAFFHGRDAFTRTLLDTVQRKNLVAVVGASGSGKSSVVRAGLVPQLRQDQQSWEILTITPGAEPLQSLIAATSPPSPDLPRAERIASLNNQAKLLTTGDVTLAQLSQSILDDQEGTERLLLVVDKWEELYTQTKDDKQRATFLQQILDATSEAPVTVVLTLRGDFYGRALGDRTVADRLQDAVVNIGPMTRDELSSAVIQPAELMGLTFQPGLVETILNDVGSEPGNLPLLEYALTELWKRRNRSGELTLEAYEETGRVKGAIATRADQIYDSLTPEAQAVCQRLMIRLVTLGEGREDTHARLILPESDKTTEEVVRTLSGSKARLLVANTSANEERQLEVSHEALIREWDQLRGWTDKNRDLLRTIERIANAKQDWEKENDTEAKNSRLLPPGRPLEEAKELLETGENELIADIRPYINLSVQRDLWRIAEEEERQHEELERERAAARAAQELARIQQEATEQAKKLAEIEGDAASKARALAESQRKQAEQAKTASQRFRTIAGVALLFAIGAMIFGVTSYWFWDQAQDQTKLAEEARAQAEIERERAKSQLRRVRMRDIKESQLLSKLAHEQHERGDAIAAILLTLRALPEDTREPERPLVSLALDELIIGMRRARERQILRGHEGSVHSAIWSEDGSQILTASWDNTARLWDTETGEERQILHGHEDWVNSAIWSADGSQILTASNDNTARLWDAATGEERQILHGHEDWVNSAIWSPDGSQVLTASWDNTARLWDTETGEERQILRGHEGPVYSAIWSPDGSQILTVSRDNTARLWWAPQDSLWKETIAAARERVDFRGGLTEQQEKEFFLTPINEENH